MELSLGQQAAALEVIAAVRDGRLCHFNGSQASIISSDGAVFVQVEVTSGQVTTSPAGGHAEYLASNPPRPADAARAQELALNWGMGFAAAPSGRRFGMHGGSSAARAIVSAMAEGRLCHFNGGQAAIAAPGAASGWVADLTTGRVEPVRASEWSEYVQRTPPRAADEAGARNLAHELGVTVVDAFVQDYLTSGGREPRKVTARTAAAAGVEGAGFGA